MAGIRLGLDFDRVLFRTDAFKKMLKERFEDFGETYPDGIYDPEEHAERLGVDRDEILEVLEEAEKFVYSDVDLLEGLEDLETVIVSRGDPVFQREKIEASGVEELVEDVKIVQEEPKDVAEIDFLVDDREKEVERVEVPGKVLDRDSEDLSDAIEAARRFGIHKTERGQEDNMEKLHEFKEGPYEVLEYSVEMEDGKAYIKVNDGDLGRLPIENLETVEQLRESLDQVEAELKKVRRRQESL